MSHYDERMLQIKAEREAERTLSDVVFGDGTLDNAKPSTLIQDAAVSPRLAAQKFGCAWLTIATVIIGIVLWALVIYGATIGG